MVFRIAQFALALLAGSAVAEDTFLVDFDVQLEKGVSKVFTVEVHPEWAPLVVVPCFTEYSSLLSSNRVCRAGRGSFSRTG